jgi:hypothetical protein
MEAMLAMLLWAACGLGTPDETLFEREIEPLLRRACYECHGSSKAKGGLRLDTAAGLAGVVQAGAPQASELVRRVASADAKERMPPKGPPLERSQVEMLSRWIADGAHSAPSAEASAAPSSGPTSGTSAEPSAHWAYRAPTRHRAPSLRHSGWVRDPLDAFVLAALEQRGLEPAPEAPLDTLLRRVALDLTGLPPPADWLFTNPADPERVYRQRVEELLASTPYAERMALAWLDLARYADTNGYEKDERRTLWPWRDWVIQAYASDLPFDQFTIRQLAGDLLPDATQADRIATGFHRNTLVNQEGGTDAEEFRFAAVIDRVHTTSTVWMGSTLACAQCHNHKFDPFSQRDYWRFFAFFNSTADTGNRVEPLLRVGSAAELAELEQLERESVPREAARQQAVRALPAVIAPALGASASDGVTLKVDEAGWVHAEGPNPERMQARSVHRFEAGPLAALRLRIDPTRAANRNWALSEVRLSRLGERVRLGVLFATREQGNGDFRAAGILDGDPATAWAAAASEAPHVHDVWLRLETPLVLEQPEEWTLELDCTSPWQGHNLASWSLARAARVPSPPDAGLEAARARLEQLRGLPQTMVLEELPQPRVTHRHEKGAFLSPAEVVTPGTPGVLPPLPEGAAADRLSLARWLVSRENPLTARVAVNRIWEQLFGRGLVATSEDFGTRGDAPTHPELLDTLAVDWMESGWSTRQLLRRIVLSATYRQEARVREPALRLDPANLWLSRSPRTRLGIEILRDQALALSGTLDATVGGPSVFPYQPEGVWNLVYSGDAWVNSEGAAGRRRGLYTFWKRSSHYATFQIFDAPSREQLCTRRSNSNTPLQALALLNDPAFADCARALAARIDAAGEGGREAALVREFERALARRASDSERRALSELQQRRGSFAVANVILNLDELLCRP